MWQEKKKTETKKREIKGRRRGGGDGGAAIGGGAKDSSISDVTDVFVFGAQESIHHYRSKVYKMIYMGDYCTSLLRIITLKIIKYTFLIINYILNNFF